MGMAQAPTDAHEPTELVTKGVLGMKLDDDFEQIFAQLYASPPTLTVSLEGRHIATLALNDASFVPCDDPSSSFYLNIQQSSGTLRSHLFRVESDMHRLNWAVSFRQVGVARKTEHQDSTDGPRTPPRPSVPPLSGSPSTGGRSHTSGPGSPLDSAYSWLDRELERGLSEGLDDEPLFRGREGDAAARIQAAARGRARRIEFSDVIQTAVVVRAARQQMEAAQIRAAMQQQSRSPGSPSRSRAGSSRGSSQMTSPNNSPVKLRGSPPRRAPPPQGIGTIAGAPAPGDYARALKLGTVGEAKAFSLPTQFMGSTVPLEVFQKPLERRDEVDRVQKQVTTLADRVKLLHALAQVQAGGSASSNAFIDSDGTLQSPKYLRLARAQHWRRCPECQLPVEHREDDGSATCTECNKAFRWLAAEPIVRVSSLRQLQVETRWQYQEMTWACGSVTTRDVARLYWLSSFTPLTRGAAVELALWRTAIALPLALSIPILRMNAARCNRRLYKRAAEAQLRDAWRNGDYPLKLKTAATTALTTSTVSSKSSLNDDVDAEPFPLILSLPGERTSGKYFANRSRLALRPSRAAPTEAIHLPS